MNRLRLFFFPNFLRALGFLQYRYVKMDQLMSIVDLDLKMELAEGFGMELKTPRLIDGGRGWGMVVLCRKVGQ